MKSRGPIIAAAAGVLVSVLVAVGLILPKMGQIKKTQDQVIAAQAQTATLTLQVNQLEDLASQASKLRQQLKDLNIQVPPNADLPGLIHDVNAAADKAAVDLTIITPGTPAAATTNPVSVVPLQLSVSGGYFSVEEFLYRIETLNRTAKVSSVTLSPDTSSSQNTGSGAPTKAPSLTAVVMANFFTTDMQSGPGSQFGHQGGSNTTSGSTTTTTTGGSGSGSSAS
jgi:type IV pilus assembly protein PilO